MAPEIVQEVIDWFMGRRKRRSYYGKVVWPKPGSPSESRRRRASDEVWLDISDEPPAEEEAVEQRVPSSSGKYPIEKDWDSGQVVNDIDEELLVAEEDDYRELPDIADKTPIKKKEAGTHIVSFMIEGNRESSEQKLPGIEGSIPTAGATPPGQTGSGISVSAFSTGKEISGSTSSEIASKIPVIPRDHQTYEEGEMGDLYYIARNDSESIVVRQMHPDCRVMIPVDYSTAIEEIKTCPLDCPYRALEVAEIDQKTLRNR